jgi:hypothetical protein
MSNTKSRLSDYEELETVGTGSFGVCTKVRRISDGKVGVVGPIRTPALALVTLVLKKFNCP